MTSSRTPGGPSTSAWSRSPSTNPRNAARLVTASLKNAVPSGSLLTDRVPAGHGRHPGGLAGVNPEVHHHLLVVAEAPRLGRARRSAAGPFERSASGLYFHRAGYAVDPEEPFASPALVEAGEVPPPATVREPPRVDPPGHSPVLETGHLPLGNGTEERCHPFVGREVGELARTKKGRRLVCREVGELAGTKKGRRLVCRDLGGLARTRKGCHVLVSWGAGELGRCARAAAGACELPKSPCRRPLLGTVQRHGGNCQPERHELVLAQAGVRELVEVPRDPVAGRTVR